MLGFITKKRRKKIKMKTRGISIRKSDLKSVIITSILITSTVKTGFLVRMVMMSMENG